MIDLKRPTFVLCISLLTSACGLVNSQAVNSGNQNVRTSANDERKNAPVGDDYEAVKSATEALNDEPPPPNPGGKIKPLARDRIREALVRHNLIGESANGELGGYKITHYSHACNLYVDRKVFYVVEIKAIQQLASSARGDARTLIFDDSVKLIHNLNAAEPLFCEGNRLFYNDYKMTVFYGEPEKQVKGNVLIFTDNANRIEGRTVNLNFYKFRDLVR